MKKRAKVTLVFFGIVIVGLVGLQVFRRVANSRDLSVERAPTPVVAKLPAQGTIEETLSYPGNLLPERTITIISRVAGRVEEILVDEGDRIESNQVLLSIEKDVVRLQKDQAHAAYIAADASYRQAVRGVRQNELDNARALLEQAENDVEIAYSNYDRAKRLLEAGSLSQAKYEEAESRYRNARTQLDNAGRSLQMMEEGATEEEIDMARANADAMRAQYELAQLQFENSEVEAPLSGIVAKVMIEEGNIIGTSTPLITIVQDDPMYAEVPVPEKYYGRILEADDTIEARIYPTAYPDRKPFYGTVVNISPVIDPRSRTFTLEVAVSNQELLLRPGMYVNVEIILDRSDNVLMVPISSIVFRDDQQVVFVVQKGESFHAEMKPVQLGIRKDGLAEVKSGISPTDQVIIKGNAFLEDGQNVDLFNEL